MSDDKTLARVAWVLPVALAAVVYYPITRNYFHFDDFLDLYQLRNEDAVHFFLRMYGGHLYIVRNAITAVLDAILGPDPVGYFAFALLSHLFNVVLTYVLTLRLTSSWRLACVAAGMWGIAPANEGAVGWYAVYGQVAATTCTLLVLVGLTGADRHLPIGWRAPIGWALLMLLGGMLFGVGIAAALVMPVVAWLMLPKTPLRPRAVTAFVVAAVVLMVIYAILRTLEPTLYGEPRIEITMMLGGLRAVSVYRHLLMLSGLVGFGAAMLPLGLFSDPLAFPSPVHVSLMTLAGLLLAAGLWCAPPLLRRRMLACLLLLLAIYGLIAVGRSMLLGYGLALVARSPRYHYATGALLSLLLAAALGAVAPRLVASPRVKNLIVAVWALAATTMVFTTTHRIDHFVADRRETVRVLDEINKAIAATPAGGTAYIPNKKFASVGFVNVNYRDRFPGTAGIFVIFFPDNVVDGRRVIFTTTDDLVMEGALRGRRSADLFAPPPELPAPGAAAKEPPP